MSSQLIVVSGVSASGKTSVGIALAKLLGWTFKDGDDFHSDSNRLKMSSGVPLTDEDRKPWLESIIKTCEEHSLMVIACSALKRKYRDLFRARLNCRFILLDVIRPLLEERIINRKGHFMPISLLDNQLATLERPVQEPDVVTISINNKDESIEYIAKKAKNLMNL